jgi:hypothetical protein
VVTVVMALQWRRESSLLITDYAGAQELIDVGKRTMYDVVGVVYQAKHVCIGPEFSAINFVIY